MKFSDILKTIGLTSTTNTIGNPSNTTISYKNNTSGSLIEGNPVDRLFHSHHRPSSTRFYPSSLHYNLPINPYGPHPYHHHHHPQLYHPSLADLSMSSSGYYYPSYLQDSGYGMKFGPNNDHVAMADGYDVNEPTGGSGGGAGGSGHHAPPLAPIQVPIAADYGYHHHQQQQLLHHPPIYMHSRSKSKNSSSATLTALTLLSFFFFINLLQNCLKEHMDAMNPTVMVMTAGVARTRLNKISEINSRESTENDSILHEHEHDDDDSKNVDQNTEIALKIVTQLHPPLQYSNNNTKYHPSILLNVNDAVLAGGAAAAAADIDDEQKYYQHYHQPPLGVETPINTKLINNKNDYFRDNYNDRKYLQIH